jgi:hypothetical protein
VPVSWRHPDAELFELVNAAPARTMDGIVAKARCRVRDLVVNQLAMSPTHHLRPL